jgi:hypothetical protein
MVFSLLKMLIMLVVHLTYATKFASSETRWAFNEIYELYKTLCFFFFTLSMGGLA